MKKIILFLLLIIFCVVSFLMGDGAWVKEHFGTINKAVERLNSLPENISLNSKFMTPSESGAGNYYLFYQDGRGSLERSGLVWVYKGFTWSDNMTEFLNSLPRERAREAKLIRPESSLEWDYYIVYRE